MRQWSSVAPGSNGDAQDKAIEIGARISDRDFSAAFWAPASIRRRRDGSQAVFPHFVLDRGKPGTLVVDSHGRRFVNEAISYHQFALEMFAQGKSAIPAFLIADAVALRKYGLGMVRPGGWGTRAAIAGRISDRRRHHRATCAEIEYRPRQFARDGRQDE